MTMIVNSMRENDTDNPLDLLENILDYGDYDFRREGRNRIIFNCETQCGRYLFRIEWNEDALALRFTVIADRPAAAEDAKVADMIVITNEICWCGFFMQDSANHIVFKSLIEIKSDDQDDDIMSHVQNHIDLILKEFDRLLLTLGHKDDNAVKSLFSLMQDQNEETMDLLSLEAKGSA